MSVPTSDWFKELLAEQLRRMNEMDRIIAQRQQRKEALPMRITVYPIKFAVSIEATPRELGAISEACDTQLRTIECAKAIDPARCRQYSDLVSEQALKAVVTALAKVSI